MPTRARRLRCWLGAALLSLLACSLFRPGAPAVTERPADFSLVYEWREGSLPPPYHYEYTLAIAADGAGSVTLVPDYPAPNVPVWTETFSLDEAALDALHAELVSAGLFATRWRALDDPPVGGSYAWLTVTAGGRQVAVPPFPVEAQSAAASRIAAAVVRVAPADVWDTLHAQREAYVAEHGG